MRIRQLFGVLCDAPCGRNRYIRIGSFLTYRGDNSTSKYQTHKKFPEYKMFTRWIHKNGKSRPDKRYKSVKSQAKTNGAKKRKKK